MDENFGFCFALPYYLKAKSYFAIIKITMRTEVFLKVQVREIDIKNIFAYWIVITLWLLGIFGRMKKKTDVGNLFYWKFILESHS